MFRTHAIIATFAATCAIATSFVSPQVHAVQRTHVSAAFGADHNTATNCVATAPADSSRRGWASPTQMA